MNKYISTEELYRLFIDCDQKITTDTRKLEAGSIFFALKGENFNANEFAINSIKGGCKYAIVDDVTIANNTTIFLVKNVLESLQELAKFHRTKLKYPIIGITGSNGKTTHKELIHAVLSKKYNTYATKGNLNNHIGVPLTLLSLTHQHEIAIVEMGANHQGEIAFLCELAAPDFGLITNIGKAHLEGFGGVEGVKKGKSELYNYLRSKNGKIFINGNDSILESLSNGLEKIFYGEDLEFDVHGKSFINKEFVEFKWNKKNETLNHQPLIKTNMFGDYNFINLLCAVCVGNYFNVSSDDINSALSSYVPEMNRSQIKKTKSNTIILDAYNANPSSMALAIDNFNHQLFNKKIAILGDMLELGEHSKTEHDKIINQLNDKNIETVYFVGELFYASKQNIEKFTFYKSTNELIEYLTNHKISEANILIKGSRGMKLEKVVDLL